MSLFNVKNVSAPCAAHCFLQVGSCSALPPAQSKGQYACLVHTPLLLCLHKCEGQQLVWSQFLLQAILKRSLTEFTVPTTYSVPCAILEDGIAAFIGVFLP